MIRRLIWLGVMLGVVGCGEEDRPASWRYIHAAIIEPSCATSSCHSEYAATFAVELYSAERAYEILTGGTCGGGEPPGRFVRPGEPDGSLLMSLLRGENVRTQMPPDRPLPEVDILLIERWIAEGASCD